MRKITLLIMLFLTMTGTIARAQVAPKISSAEKVYEYYIQSGSSRWFQLGSSTNVKFTGNSTPSDLAKFKLIEATVEGYEGTEQLVKLVPTNKTGYTYPVSPNNTTSDNAVYYRNEASTGNLDVWVLSHEGDNVYRLKAYTNQNRAFTAWSNGNAGVWAYNATNGAAKLIFHSASTHADDIDVTTGYYKIKNARQNTMYLKNDADINTNTMHHTFENKNNYIWKVDVNGVNFTITNGQGTPVRVSGTAYETMTAVAKMGEKTYVFDNYLNGPDHTTANATLFVWPADVNATGNQWVFEEVTAGTAYQVVIGGVGIPTDVMVTYTSTGEKAFDGGFFMIEGTPNAEDFEATNSPVITIEGTTVKVTYMSAEVVIADALAALATPKNIVGLTPADLSAYDALQSVYDTYEANNTSANLLALDNAVTTFNTAEKLAITVGKAYTLTYVEINDTKHYLVYDSDNNYKLVNTKPDTDAAKLICSTASGNTYTFSNNAGKYFVWFGKYAVMPDGTSFTENAANKGYVDAYNATYCPIQFKKLSAKISTAPAHYYYMVGPRKTNAELATSVINKNAAEGTGGVNANSGDSPMYQDSHTSAIIIEEVPYPNTPELKAADGIDGIEAIATWSAPFVTVAPAGVEAYMVGSETPGYVGVAKLEGAIPANTGVLLTGAAGTVTMVPATTETAANATGNLLKHSAGSTTTTVAGKHILTKQDGKVAFYPVAADNTTALGMNKAYLDLSGNGVRAISFDFGGATAIESVEAQQNGEVKTFDLSGRRVNKAVKGLYIQNGKKVIIK